MCLLVSSFVKVECAFEFQQDQTAQAFLKKLSFGRQVLPIILGDFQVGLAAAFCGHPIGSVFLIILIDIYGYSLYMDDIWMIYGL